MIGRGGCPPVTHASEGRAWGPQMKVAVKSSHSIRLRRLKDSASVDKVEVINPRSPLPCTHMYVHPQIHVHICIHACTLHTWKSEMMGEELLPRLVAVSDSRRLVCGMREARWGLGAAEPNRQADGPVVSVWTDVASGAQPKLLHVELIVLCYILAFLAIQIILLLFHTIQILKLTFLKNQLYKTLPVFVFIETFFGVCL